MSWFFCLHYSVKTSCKVMSFMKPLYSYFSKLASIMQNTRKSEYKIFLQGADCAMPFCLRLGTNHNNFCCKFRLNEEHNLFNCLILDYKSLSIPCTILKTLFSIWKIKDFEPYPWQGGQFDTTFSDISRTFKRVQVQFWNFLTFLNIQNKIFGKIWIPILSHNPPPPLEGGY